MTVMDVEPQLCFTLDGIEGAAEDLEAAQRWDAEHRLSMSSADLVAMRYAALVDAFEQHGAADGCGWTPFPVRQCALELAASLTALAARLPRPTVPAKQERTR